MPEEELPMKDMGEISGYFIECYCKPGEFYTLNAAKVSPIHEIIDLSDPVNLDVSIKADSIIKLIPTFSPSFLGNFRHDTKFSQFGIDSLYLSIYTPEKNTSRPKPPYRTPSPSLPIPFPRRQTPSRSASQPHPIPCRITIYIACRQEKKEPGTTTC